MLSYVSLEISEDGPYEMHGMLRFVLLMHRYMYHYSLQCYASLCRAGLLMC
jgi:hypothetical protein